MPNFVDKRGHLLTISSPNGPTSGFDFTITINDGLPFKLSEKNAGKIQQFLEQIRRWDSSRTRERKVWG